MIIPGTGYPGSMPMKDPAERALWFIESHFTQEISLDDIARSAAVSRYHLSRIFGFATGQSIMQYVRQRRLTEAARTLANGAPDILNIALHAGYNSHEAFTRAFHDHFGITPEALRAQGNLSNIKLTEPIRMDQTVLTKLDAPRIENGKAMLIAGMGRRYNNETCAAIPAQWQEFSQHLGRIRAQVGTAAFGVLCNGDDAGYIDYICGVQVSGFSKIPDNWTRLEIPEQRYAVFLHRDHISTIRRTWFTIFNTWLQKSEYKAADGPEFELYRETFNPPTGLGDVEIWVPIH